MAMAIAMDDLSVVSMISWDLSLLVGQRSSRSDDSLAIHQGHQMPSDAIGCHQVPSGPGLCEERLEDFCIWTHFENSWKANTILARRDQIVTACDMLQDVMQCHMFAFIDTPFTNNLFCNLRTRDATTRNSPFPTSWLKPLKCPCHRTAVNKCQWSASGAAYPYSSMPS